MAILSIRPSVCLSVMTRYRWQAIHRSDGAVQAKVMSLYVCLSLCLSVASGLTLDSVYKSLNHTVLYLLSRPVSVCLYVCMSVSVCLSVSVSVCSVRSDVGQCLQVTKPYRALSTVTSRVCVSVCLYVCLCMSVCLCVCL